MPWDDVTITINGTDRTEHLVLHEFEVRHAQNGRSTAKMRMLDKAGAYRPSDYHAIDLDINGTALFSGVITSFDETLIPGETTLIRYEISCQDLSALFDKRFVFKEYTLTNGGTLDVIVNDLITNYGDGLGIAWNGTGVGPVFLNPIKFNGDSLTACFNRLSELSGGWQWRVTVAGELVWYDPAVGNGAASISLTDTSANFEAFKVKRNLALHANTVVAKSSASASSVWTDTFTGDGSTFIWPTTYALNVKPIITVDAVEMVVGTADEVAAATAGLYDFSYIPGGIGVQVVAGGTIPASGEVIEVSYPSPVNPHVSSSDAAQEAADGYRIEKLVEVANIDSMDTLQAYCDAKLAELKTRPVEIELTTRAAMLWPGELLAVNLTKAGINDTFLVDQVNYRGGARRQNGITGPFVVQSVKATTDIPQRAGRFLPYMERLVQRSTSAQDRGAAEQSGSTEGATGMVNAWQVDSSSAERQPTMGAVTGDINGINRTFYASRQPDPGMGFQCCVDGVVKGWGVDYILAGTVVEFVEGAQPQSGAVIEFQYPAKRIVAPPEPLPVNTGIARDYSTYGGSFTDSLNSWVDWAAKAKWGITGDWSFCAWFKFSAHAALTQGVLVSHGATATSGHTHNYELVVWPTDIGAGIYRLSIQYKHSGVWNETTLERLESIQTDYPITVNTPYWICAVRNPDETTVYFHVGNLTQTPIPVGSYNYGAYPPATASPAQAMRTGSGVYGGGGQPQPLTSEDTKIGPHAMANVYWDADQRRQAWLGLPQPAGLVLWSIPVSPGNDPEVNEADPDDDGDVNLAPIVTNF